MDIETTLPQTPTMPGPEYKITADEGCASLAVGRLRPSVHRAPTGPTWTSAVHLVAILALQAALGGLFLALAASAALPGGLSAMMVAAALLAVNAVVMALFTEMGKRSQRQRLVFAAGVILAAAAMCAGASLLVSGPIASFLTIAGTLVNMELVRAFIRPVRLR
jgi:hypothetical protein